MIQCSELLQVRKQDMRETHQKFHQALLEPSPSSGRDGVEQSQVKYELLRRVRWYVIAAQLAVMYPAWKTGYLVDQGRTLILYLIIVVSLALWNLQRHPFAVAGGIFFELSLDLLALSGLLILTSGCQNPFFPLLYVGAVIGPILLPRRWAVAYLFESALAMMLVCLWTEPDMLNASGHKVSGILTVGVKVLVVFIMGALALWLKTHLDQAQIHRDALQKQRQKLNNLRVMGIVAGQLSHEIATPLNTLRLMLDRLQRKETDRHELQVARAALEQCERSLRNLFETGVDAGNLSYPLSSRSVNSGSSISLMCSSVSAANLSLKS
jgi:two-component system sensor histidine kinase RegB